jgi:hypothetical protein
MGSRFSGEVYETLQDEDEEETTRVGACSWLKHPYIGELEKCCRNGFRDEIGNQIAQLVALEHGYGECAKDVVAYY